MKPQTIRKIRSRLRWTQAKLAKQVGVTTRTLQNWERRGCKADSPAANLLKTLA